MSRPAELRVAAWRRPAWVDDEPPGTARKVESGTDQMLNAARAIGATKL